MSNEFRSVHAAREVLAQYIASGRDLKLVREVKVGERFDVWQAVFEKEPAAIRELQIREFYDDCLRIKKSSGETLKCYLTFIIARLNQYVEWDCPMKIGDAVQIILDIFDKNEIMLLQQEAETHLERRKEIVKPYFKKDDEWVKFSQTVVNHLNKIK